MMQDWDIEKMADQLRLIVEQHYEGKDKDSYGGGKIMWFTKTETIEHKKCCPTCGDDLPGDWCYRCTFLNGCTAVDLAKAVEQIRINELARLIEQDRFRVWKYFHEQRNIELNELNHTANQTFGGDC